jgi:hypothetical protein
MPDGISASTVLGPPSPLNGAPAPAARAPALPQPAATPEASASESWGGDLRLNIERQDSGAFVYKFIDPSSGRVVQEIPNEEVLKLRRSAAYSAGRLISTRL